MKRAREDEVDSSQNSGASLEQQQKSSSSRLAAPVLGARGPAISCSQREAFLPVAVDNMTRSAVQNLTLELVFGTGNVASNAKKYLGERPELPGPLPISLSRRSLATSLLTHPYMVCEKSDGERNFLLSISKHTRDVPAGTYLIDRSFKVQSLGARSIDYALFLSPNGPTLLDGELVLRSDDAGTGTGAKAVFYVFDCAACNGEDLAGKGANLEKRLAYICDGVRSKFTIADNARLANGALMFPLYVCGKVMVDKSMVRTILDRVSETKTASNAGGDLAGGGIHGNGKSTSPINPLPLLAPLESELGVSATSSSQKNGGASSSHQTTLRIYRHDIRVNGTDGLIFTPVFPSFRQLFDRAAPAPLLKWKYVDEITIDFELRRSELQDAEDKNKASSLVPLFVAGFGQKIAHCELSKEQVRAYDNLCGKLGEESIIVECAFEAAFSRWEIRRIRDRKKRPNFVTTAWSTLESVAEALTAQELCSALLKH
jgi:hypothetical protein